MIQCQWEKNVVDLYSVAKIPHADIYFLHI